MLRRMFTRCLKCPALFKLSPWTSDYISHQTTPALCYYVFMNSSKVEETRGTLIITSPSMHKKARTRSAWLQLTSISNFNWVILKNRRFYCMKGGAVGYYAQMIDKCRPGSQKCPGVPSENGQAYGRPFAPSCVAIESVVKVSILLPPYHLASTNDKVKQL